MTLHDGYGDQPTIDEILADYDAWLHARAHQMLTPTDHRHDDLVQEGRIAMWRAWQRYRPSRGALPSWLTQHATWHMHQVLTRGGTWTGKPRGASTSRLPIRVHTLHSLDAALTPETGTPARDDLAGTTPDIADQAMLAYHHGEIARSVALLSAAQRRYVQARFHNDLRGTEMRDTFGYDPSALWNSPRNGAKHKLRHHLGHLESAA